MSRELDDQEAVAMEGLRGRVVWARDERGKMPAREFYRKLPVSDQAKIQALFRKFADYGTIPNTQKFRRLKGEGLYEFKIWGLRFLGGIVGADIFIVAHAVKKKMSGSLRPSEFERARRLLNLNVLRFTKVESDAPN